MDEPSGSGTSTRGSTMKNPRHVGQTDALTIVIKLGTSSIVSDVNLQPRLALLSALVETCVSLRRAGHRVVLVSSGAIAMGMRRMTGHEGGIDGKWGKRPKALAEKQALAAIGQGHLIALWDNLFSQVNQPIAQILLTRNDLADRSRYLNATSTLATLLNAGVIPIVNENDTVSVSEIKFGDNDTLSAVAAGMCSADYLFLLTDVDCLYTKNPRTHADARPVLVVRDIEGVRSLVSTTTLGSSLGTGGMSTKLIAAELATGAGVATVICHGSKPTNILPIACSVPQLLDPSQPALLGQTSADRLLEGSDSPLPLHTLFLPRPSPLSDRKFWIAHGLAPKGKVVIDAGAFRAISRDSGGRLLAAGVLRVEGNFMAGQAVRVWVAKGRPGRADGTSRRRPSDHSGDNTPIGMRSLSNSLSDIRAADGERPSPLSTTPAEPSGTSPDDAEEDLEEIGRGLANYHATEIDKIKGLRSSEIEGVLGHIDSENVVEGIALLRRSDGTRSSSR